MLYTKLTSQVATRYRETRMDEEKVKREEKEKPKPRPKLLKVSVAERRGNSVLVERETNGKLERRLVPALELLLGKDHLDTKVAEDVWDAGVSYGVDWEALAEVTVTPRQIADELRRRGIWTAEDFYSRYQEMRQVIAGLHMCDFAELLRRLRG